MKLTLDSKTAFFLSNLAIAISVLFCVILLAPRGFAHFSENILSFQTNIVRLKNTTPHERKLETYGDQDIMGYGYLSRVLENFPLDHTSPLIRFPYIGLNVTTVLPGYRYTTDERFLVGIDLTAQDLQSRIISKATIIQNERKGVLQKTGWGFTTTLDYDTLDFIRLHFRKKPGSEKQHIKATMLHSPTRRESIGHWSWLDQTIDNVIDLKLNPPIKKAYNRGGLPFILFMENIALNGTPISDLVAIEIGGTKVNAKNYQILHQEGKCFTAIDIAFLKQILRNGSEEWFQYISNLTNNPEISAALIKLKQHTASMQKEEVV